MVHQARINLYEELVRNHGGGVLSLEAFDWLIEQVGAEQASFIVSYGSGDFDRESQTLAQETIRAMVGEDPLATLVRSVHWPYQLASASLKDHNDGSIGQDPVNTSAAFIHATLVTCQLVLGAANEAAQRRAAS